MLLRHLDDGFWAAASRINTALGICQFVVAAKLVRVASEGEAFSYRTATRSAVPSGVGAVLRFIP